jgi:hypothetical protein
MLLGHNEDIVGVPGELPLIKTKIVPWTLQVLIEAKRLLPIAKRVPRVSIRRQTDEKNMRAQISPFRKPSYLQYRRKHIDGEENTVLICISRMCVTSLGLIVGRRRFQE